MFWEAICGIALIPNGIRFKAEEMKCTFSLGKELQG
jgi:hypothetical protein